MAATAVLKSRHHPKLLSLQHVESLSDDCCSLSAPMTPLAGDVGLLAATVSPRDPAMKLAAAAAPMNKKPASAAGPGGFASHRLSIRHASSAASSSSDETSSEAEDEEEDDDSTAQEATCKPVKGNTGRWTEAEHKLFLQGLETFPYRAWKKIATLIKTRTVVQIRTHAQKYYQKLEKEEARMKEREQQLAQHHDRPSAASSSSSRREATEAVVTPTSSPSPQKKKHLMRKRKSSTMLDLDTESDASEASAPLPSLPKRMAREKKFAAHMSPKQKVAAVSSSNAKLFFGSQFSSPEFSAAAASPELHARLSSPFSRGNKMALQQQLQLQQQQTPPQHHVLPLDFVDSAAESMILDFADDKGMGDYAFSLDGSCMDQGMSSIDNDDLLQLTEEEMDWFSTTSGDQDALKAESQSEPAPMAAVSGVKAEEDVTPLSLDRFQFPEVNTDELVRLDEATGAEGTMTGLLSSGSTSAISDSVYGSELCFEDEDFVLDPEKFLSSYFSPADAAQAS